MRLVICARAFGAAVGVTAAAALPLLYACAEASTPGADASPPIGDRPDASGFPSTPDADEGSSDPDAAPPESVTITDNASLDLLEDSFANCNYIDDDEQPVANAQNAYYRVFDLSGHDIDSDFQVEEVHFGISSAEGSGGTQPVRVVVGHQSDSDVPDPDGHTSLFDEEVEVSDREVEFLDVPIDESVPAGESLYVEFEIPDGQEEENLLLVGVNEDDEDSLAYYSSEGCNDGEGFEFQPLEEVYTTTWVVSVTGTHQP